LPFAPHRDKGRRPVFSSLLSCASLSSCVHVWSIFFASFLRSQQQVFRVLSLFLFPWRFRLRACLVVLMAGLRRVWPIQLQALSYLQMYRLLIRLLPQLFVTDVVRPAYSEDPSQTVVDECLDFLCGVHCSPPGFCPVQ
jgi:hypothetical protein